MKIILSNITATFNCPPFYLASCNGWIPNTHTKHTQAK